MDITAHFQDIFEPQLLTELRENSKSLTAKAGDVILDVGQTVKFMPLVLKGTIKITRIDSEGREILLYYVNANEGCAMTFTCCMEQFPSEIKATAEDNVEMLGVSIALMDKWMMTYTTWKSFVMRTIRNRFNELLLTVDRSNLYSPG